jgi:hypothetical protein
MHIRPKLQDLFLAHCIGKEGVDYLVQKTPLTTRRSEATRKEEVETGEGYCDTTP